MTILLRQKPLPQVVRQIVQRDNGAWFDPSDLSTLYQDAAGTVPVTAVGQPVGLVLDKSKGLMLGPELVTNGSFDLNIIGWTPTTPALVGWQNGELILTNTSSGYQEQANYALTPYVSPNKIYTVSVRARRGTADYFSLVVDGNSVPERYITNLSNTEMQTYNFTFLHREGQTSCTFRIRAGGVGTVYLDNVSVREVLGSHASQPITASRPTLIYENGLYGLSFDGIDDYLNLPYMGLYANGSASIVAARDALSQTADTYVISERSTSNVNPKYFPSRQLANAGNMDSYIVNDAAAVVVDTVGSAYGGASDAVVRSAIDSGNNIKLFKNGALAANDNYTRSGTLTLTNTTIGASVSTTTSNYANMRLYGLCIAKSALSDLERRRVERLLAYNSGVQI